ncbi:putative short chain dehydrogenase/reductase family oxidoreductase [Fonsecaea pedrosoi]|nr:putative short chain dehydrogenase/reductase family oxidoreductase [Fonsecaea pedrosoi]
MTSSVAGKTALVTGAGSGINLAFARLLLSRGCNVVFADLNLRPEALELVNAHQRPPATAQAVFQKTDVSSWKDLSDTYELAKSRFTRVDIVCPGAGVFEPAWSSFWRPPGTDPGVVDGVASNGYKSLDINLTHPIRLTQLAIMDQVRELKAAKGGGDSGVPPRRTVIHVSSVNGQVAPLWSPLYNTAKHALNGFVRTMGPLEGRLGIRIAAVAPGLVNTPIWSTSPDKSGPLPPDPAWVTPEEVAQVMLDMVEKDQVSTLLRGDAGTDESTQKEGLVHVAGGSILEVSGNQVRDVAAFFDPGPQGISSQDFDMEKMENSVYQALEKIG